MDQPTLERLLTTLEGNAMSNTKLATSVEGMSNEVRGLATAVAANTTEVQRLCASHEKEDERKAKTGAMVWALVKHPSTMILTAFALWLAATVFGVVPQTQSAPAEAGAQETVEVIKP